MKKFDPLLFHKFAEKKAWWNACSSGRRSQIWELIEEFWNIQKTCHLNKINNGLEKAKLNGRIGGRPTYYDPSVIKSIKKLRKTGATNKYIYELFGIPRSTYYYMLKSIDELIIKEK